MVGFFCIYYLQLFYGWIYTVAVITEILSQWPNHYFNKHTKHYQVPLLVPHTLSDLNYLPLTLQAINIVKIKRPGGWWWKVATKFSVKLQGNRYQ